MRRRRERRALRRLAEVAGPAVRGPVIGGGLDGEPALVALGPDGAVVVSRDGMRVLVVGRPAPAGTRIVRRRGTEGLRLVTFTLGWAGAAALSALVQDSVPGPAARGTPRRPWAAHVPTDEGERVVDRLREADARALGRHLGIVPAP